jgi:hypothetical protein
MACRRVSACGDRPDRRNRQENIETPESALHEDLLEQSACQGMPTLGGRPGADQSEAGQLILILK